MELRYQIILAALLLVNIVAFAAYGIDKRKAQKGRWRIPESTLLLLAFFGGAIGALMGMRVFHHKTKHWKFKILVPLFLILQFALAGWFFYRGIAL
mgnify:CR=1 FL=1